VNSDRTGWAARLTPPALQGYQRSWLRADILAGPTLAAVAIPETMGYASIAQVPVITGLYTVLFPALFGVLQALHIDHIYPTVEEAVAGFRSSPQGTVVTDRPAQPKE